MTHPLSSAFNRLTPWALVVGTMPAALIGFVTGLYLGQGIEAKEEHLPSPLLATPAKADDGYKNECSCGEVRTCPFGPGIVGQQKCWTSVVMGNEWTRCEPAPKGSE